MTDTFILKNLTIREISLTGDPANEESTVEIVKAKGGKIPCADCPAQDECIVGGACKKVAKANGDIGVVTLTADPPSFAERMAAVDAEAKADDVLRRYDRLQWTLRDSLVAILRTPGLDDKNERVAQSIAEYTTALQTLAPELVLKAENGGLAAIIEAAELAAGTSQETIMNLQEIQKALDDAKAALESKDAELAKAKTALDAATATATAAQAELAKSKAAGAQTPDEQHAEFLKSLPPGARAHFEAQAAKTAALEAEVAKARDEKDGAESFAKAKALGIGDPAKLGPALRNIRKNKATDDDFKVLDETLALAAGIVKSTAGRTAPFLAVVGGDNAADSGDPQAQMDAKANELVEKSKASGKPLSFAQASTEVMATPEGQKLYAAIVRKNKQRAAAAAAGA